MFIQIYIVQPPNSLHFNLKGFNYIWNEAIPVRLFWGLVSWLSSILFLFLEVARLVICRPWLGDLPWPVPWRLRLCDLPGLVLCKPRLWDLADLPGLIILFDLLGLVCWRPRLVGFARLRFKSLFRLVVVLSSAPPDWNKVILYRPVLLSEKDHKFENENKSFIYLTFYED